MGSESELSMWIALMENLRNFLCQSAYSAIDSFLVLFDGLDD